MRRMSTDPSAKTLSDLSGERPDPTAGDARALVDMHRSIAARMLREGSGAQAFGELVRAAREVPMNARLAASLVRVAVGAQAFGPAMTLIAQGVDEAEGAERVGVLRQLARLSRFAGELDRALEALAQLLAENPNDRRARAVLNALLEREQRWDELDASLEKETKEALRRGALRAASRVALRRGRLWGERLDDHARAALRFMQASTYAEQARDFESAFLLRLLWLRSLHRSEAPARMMNDAVTQALAAGERVGKVARAKALVQELGLGTTRDLDATTTDPPEAPQRREHSAETSPAIVALEEPAAPPRRRSTQLELVAVAEEAQKAGRSPEAAAILEAAAHEGPDPQAAAKLEAHYIARGAWRELASFYRDAVARAGSKEERARWAEKLAEILESELSDPSGAAKAWSEVVASTGDSRAVSEQVRLLAQKKDASGVRAALDAGVKQAQAGPERAQALVLRAEEALTRREVAAARADFEAAVKLSPLHPAANAGLAELAAMQGDYAPIRSLEAALAKVPRRTPGRGDLFRRLARLADSPLRDQKLARAAWAEVLAELPADEEASTRTLALLRTAGDDLALEAQLRALLQQEPRGPRARQARLELVALLERAGRNADALAALKDACRTEPGHRDAWLGYAERLLALGGRDGEAAWALEHAATATEEPVQRLKLWQRLARISRERLHDEAKAATFTQRADRLQREVLQEMPEPAAASPLPGGPLVIPQKRAPKGKAAPLVPSPREEDLEAIASALESRLEPDEQEHPSTRAPARARPFPAPFESEALTPEEAEPAAAIHEAAPEEEEFDDEEPGEPTRELPIGDDEEAEPAAKSVITRSLEEDDADGVQEIRSGDIEAPEEEDRQDLTPEAPDEEPEDEPPVEEGRRTQELAVELGDPKLAVPPSFGTSPAKAMSAERKALFERVRSNPLEPDGYRLLAEHFDTASDPTRSSLMLEIARALEGDPHAAPRTPRLILNATDRAGLKHPSLRGEPGELLNLVGIALCRLHPAKGKDASTAEEFNLTAGKGARAAADALLAAVRILGLRAPDVFISEDQGPPFSLIFATEPRLLVGKSSVKRETPDSELRFFAGRALFTQLPELMALRNLRREHLLRGMATVAQVANGKTDSAEARVIREAVPARAWDRVRQLFKSAARKLDYSALSEGARHSANRAGLVVCGGIAPAIAALRAKKALPTEMTELVRFAASERYLQMRSRMIPKK